MDGLLVVDKPAGPTSHDVVARIRRALREPRIGHTGTLDPAATGVLALVLGRATRLAQFLSGRDKSYEAVVRLGFATDTADAEGCATGAVSVALPGREEIDAALDAFRGTFLQQPPAFSAKKIDGKRSHKLARARARAIRPDLPDPPSLAVASQSFGVAGLPGLPDPRDPLDLPGPPAPPALPALASVTVHRLEVLNVEADTVTLSVDCSAGFYVRSLAHDLGARLGVGGHLIALRRTRSGDFGLAEAIDLDTAERRPDVATARVIPMACMLPGLSPVVLTPDGLRKAIHGRELGPGDCVSGFGIRESGLEAEESGLDAQSESRIPSPESRLYRLLDEAGSLVGIGRRSIRPMALHPSVVLV